ncbi:MAG TPA: DUF58 domain-containing protein [Longimicrobiales bacterium]|nr:DUF58 domain-containing protein [Longimicrobiales bacterium]
MRNGAGRARDGDTSHVFSRETAAQLRRIELRTRGLVESLFGGEYHSVFKGRGLEFSDVREYQPGDDVRSIDWNVTARRGRLFVKEYVEERELTALLIVDLSASKEFGTGPSDNALLACEIASILALAAAANNDRVGLLLVTEQVELFIPPDSGRRHVLRLVLELLTFQPTGRRTRLSAALDYASRVMHRRSAVFLVSDFLTDADADPGLPRIARRFSREHDLVPIRLTDPRGGSLPDVGLLALIDPETGRRHIVDTSAPAVRAEYESRTSAQQDAMTALFRDLRLDAIEIDTHGDCVPPLIRFFRRRMRITR